MIVVGTNVIAALYLTSDLTHHAESLILQDVNWVAPLLWRSELRNVLTKYMRAGNISHEQAYQIQHQAEMLMTGNEYQSISLDVLKLANSSQSSAYDCEFVALARHLQVKLITQDKQILAQFPDDTIALKDIEISKVAP